MADVSKVNVNGESYDIKDVTARARNIPAGGTTGQILRKSSGTDYDAAWSEELGPASGIPTGGTTGQILVKQSDDDYDAGWYTPGHLPTGTWYLPTGVSESNVIAAWQFVGRSSEAEALININEGTEYALVKSGVDVVWNSDSGFYIPAGKTVGLNNAVLASAYANILSAAFGFSGLSIASGNKHAGGLTPASSRALLLRGLQYDEGFVNQFMINNHATSGSPIYKASTLYDNGVLAGNWFASDRALYYNGETQSLASGQNAGSASGILLGQPTGTSASNSVPFYVTAFVLYNITLSATQHMDLANNIRGLGGNIS